MLLPGGKHTAHEMYAWQLGNVDMQLCCQQISPLYSKQTAWTKWRHTCHCTGSICQTALNMDMAQNMLLPDTVGPSDVDGKSTWTSPSQQTGGPHCRPLVSTLQALFQFPSFCSMSMAFGTSLNAQKVAQNPKVACNTVPCCQGRMNSKQMVGLPILEWVDIKCHPSRHVNKWHIRNRFHRLCYMIAVYITRVQHYPLKLEDCLQRRSQTAQTTCWHLSCRPICQENDVEEPTFSMHASMPDTFMESILKPRAQGRNAVCKCCACKSIKRCRVTGTLERALDAACIAKRLL